jgi:hypothetical protein
MNMARDRSPPVHTSNSPSAIRPAAWLVTLQDAEQLSRCVIYITETMGWPG